MLSELRIEASFITGELYRRVQVGVELLKIHLNLDLLRRLSAGGLELYNSFYFVV